MTANFHSLTDFLHMGGYAAYVWSAYGIVAIVLIAQVISAARAIKRKKP